MALHNSEIADRFDRLADLLEIEGANPFRVRAYRNAARTVRGYPRSMADLLADDVDLTELPDIGDDLAKKIEGLVSNGELPLLDEVEERTPPALSELMKIQGLGAKRVRALHEAINIETLEDLRAAVESGQVRAVEGFGEKSEDKIRRRLKKFSGKDERIKLSEAEQIAAPLVKYLEKANGLKEIVVAGSFRRRKETVGDLDILITAKTKNNVMEHFTSYEDIEEVASRGETRSTVYLRCGMQVDLRVVPQVSFGSAQHYFTGSKDHNIAVRKLGIKKGYKINEYGVFEGDKRIAGETEKSVYASVDLPLIPPELRENRGELEAARENQLPDLVRLEDLRGNLHTHTDATDGRNSLKSMAAAAAEFGLEYLAITDHSKHLKVAHGLDEKRLKQQLQAIDKLNDELSGIRLLKSIEVDILQDGKLDLADSVLEQLDLVLCAVHHKFDLSKQKQTERILRAMDSPHCHILAHPSGRLINRREAYDIDLEKILEAAAARSCAVELNAQPDRLDLTDEGCRMARELGVKVSIAADAHSARGFDTLRFGVDQARRGWLEADDVLNTRPLKALLEILKR
ncbi:DNA polymerase III [Microbulbifer flavimaris]|uniref:DNA polymerase beta n=1 Tax=Microbulbifer flavimaris TaxID=1781068 RepID=A0ABX4HVG7_9GAMM|nr:MULTISPECIES: DNA polymerase/3'-5' exonuclease PolX [Microbulbifer]KUJ79158.1 DNA polymerase III [Microbulbifer sp. ZGT114]PCO04081.1 DNA polymerase III [Microbulbifer flavimaris]